MGSMKKCFLMLATLPLFIACSHGHSESHDEHDDHDHEHAGEILLDPHMAEHLGVEISAVEPGRFRRVVRASGILERNAADVATAPASAAGTVRLAPGVTAGAQVQRGSVLATIDSETVSGGNADAAARAEFEAAQTEFERVERLYADRLVTAAEFNAAKAALERSRAALSRGGESRRVVAPISGTITAIYAPQGAYVQPGDPVAGIAADGALTLKVDAPSRSYSQLESVTDARFTVDSNQTLTVSSLGGRRLAGTAADGTRGYVPVYFSVPSSAGIPAGASADVWLLGAERDGVITVPKSALSEQQGLYYVFVAEHPEEGAYRKVPVSIGDSDGERVEILSGLSGGEQIVTAGATAVRLAEIQSVVPEGHSHSH